jgi:protein SCO1/2
MRCPGIALALAVALVSAPLAARAASDTNPPELRNVGIDQHLNKPVPLDLPFRNEAGETVTLRSLMRGKPVILSLAYYQCPMLCTLVLNGLTSAMRALPFDAGNEFDVITVSFDPDARARRGEEDLPRGIGARARQGWHFLTAMRRRSSSSPRRSAFAAENQFARRRRHGVTPDGILSRYFYGVEFAPRDLKFGLLEAADRKIGSPVDQLLLFCFQYDPSTGRYTNTVMTAIRIGAVLTLLALGTMMAQVPNPIQQKALTPNETGHRPIFRVTVVSPTRRRPRPLGSTTSICSHRRQPVLRRDHRRDADAFVPSAAAIRPTSASTSPARPCSRSPGR